MIIELSNLISIIEIIINIIFIIMISMIYQNSKDESRVLKDYFIYKRNEKNRFSLITIQTG